MSTLDEWQREVFPNDLGDGNHRWSWLVSAATSRDEFPPGVANYIPTTKDILWLHRCKDGKFSTGWIDLTSGTRHRLVSSDPLTIEPSILCPVCGDHGYIRNDEWVIIP